jgi:hypothetical protein
MKTPSFEGYNIPEHTQESLTNYIERGYKPGGFLTAVLCNDLFGSLSSADHLNKDCLEDIVRWIYMNLPPSMYKTENNINAWCQAVKNGED